MGTTRENIFLAAIEQHEQQLLRIYSVYANNTEDKKNLFQEVLIQIWQSSTNQERIKFEKSRLILDVQSNLVRFNRTVKYRVLSETGGAIFAIPIFAYQVYAIPFSLSKIVAAMIVVWIIYVINRYRGARKYKPSPFTATYMEYPYKSKQYLYVQKRLADTALFWYILPCLSAVILFIPGGYLGGRMDTKAFIMLILGVMISGPLLYLWTKRAAKIYLTPKLKKIDGLIKVMEE